MLKIRNFNEDDRQVLRRIFLSSRKETFSWLDTSAYTHEDFDEATAKESIMIAEEEGVVMGFIAFLREGSFIHHLYIDPDHLKKGAGKALLNAAVHTLEQPVRLKCLIKNKNAVAFYKAQHWKFEMAGTDAAGRYYLLKNQ
jgi:GNAT superfamily N-acetyltransferase